LILTMQTHKSISLYHREFWYLWILWATKYSEV